ncbi:hypothetical protein ACFQEX_12770 [Roseibium salinum]|uniref:hypothetical protein n=1 Tax=Roseibium salinum TaxID=1604349 RepID=UPI003611B419
MEPVVPLEGVQKLRAGADHFAARPGESDGRRRDGVGVPLDGRSVLFSTLDRETLLVAGVGDAFAGNLQVILNDDPKTAAPCTLVTLPLRKPASANKPPFIAVLSLRQMRGETLERVTIRSHGHSYPYVLKHGPVDLAAFLNLVSEVSKQPETEIVDSLVDALLSGKSAAGGTEIAAKVVRSIARQDGFIEVLGSFDQGDAYVQGWAKGLPAGSCRVLVLGDGLTVAELTSGLFERKDTGGKAFGFSGLLTAQTRLNAHAIRSLVFRGRSNWSTVDVHEKRSLLEAHGIPGQIRSLLPRLSGSGDGKRKLVAAAHRFDGRETVSELDVPVRIGIDFCAAVDRGGVMLSGWLLDPEDRVEAVFPVG